MNDEARPRPQPTYPCAKLETGDKNMNWKTTTLGILTIIAGLVNAGIEYCSGKAINYATIASAITAGWGLIHASDASLSK